jgi:hypothetical protein
MRLLLIGQRGIFFAHPARAAQGRTEGHVKSSAFGVELRPASVLGSSTDNVAAAKCFDKLVPDQHDARF